MVVALKSNKQICKVLYSKLRHGKIKNDNLFKPLVALGHRVWMELINRGTGALHYITSSIQLFLERSIRY